MSALGHHEVTWFLIALAVLLAVARLLGELSQRLGQPAVLGEILAGVSLGPTVLGRLSPELTLSLFPSTGAPAVAFNSITLIAVSLFLMVAGIEVELSSLWRQGKTAIAISISGSIIPFVLGFVAASAAPDLLGGHTESGGHIFALFFATAVSISALPVIAKTLMDLGLFRTHLGITIIAAAIFNDLTGWIIFALILAMMGQEPAHGYGVMGTAVLTLGFTAVMLTVVRMGLDRLLERMSHSPRGPGRVLALALVLSLAGAAFTEWAGVHAIFGAFMAGVALGDSHHLRQHTRTVLDDFISFFFAPLFFASIGLKVDFLEAFDPLIVGVVLVIAFVGKIGGCWLGARWAGLSDREAWALGFGMNARGAMEIILGLLALQAGIIGEPLFVALVVMALVTSMMAGPGMSRMLDRKRALLFTDYLSSRGLAGHLEAEDRWEALDLMAGLLASEVGLKPAELAAALKAREEVGGTTGLGNGVAVPHARLPGIKRPVVAVGLFPTGVDFDCSDGLPVRMVVAVLTPEGQAEAQLCLLADIARVFRLEDVVEEACQAANASAFQVVVEQARARRAAVASAA